MRENGKALRCPKAVGFILAVDREARYAFLRPGELHELHDVATARVQQRATDLDALSGEMYVPSAPAGMLSAFVDGYVQVVAELAPKLIRRGRPRGTGSDNRDGTLAFCHSRHSLSARHTGRLNDTTLLPPLFPEGRPHLVIMPKTRIGKPFGRIDSTRRIFRFDLPRCYRRRTGSYPSTFGKRAVER